MAEEKTSIDIEKVEQIVNRMKRKYEKAGLSFEETTGELGELRKIVAGEKRKGIEVQRVEELKEFESAWISRLGSIFLSLKGVMKPFYGLLTKMPQTQELAYYLDSANMRFSARQWLAISTVVAFLAFIITLIISSSAAVIFNLNPVIPIIIAIFVFILAGMIMLLIPKRNATLRGKEISKELPFALRHLATELKAGIGLYRSIQIIATSDYGSLTEEFKKMTIEIEEGLDTEEALKNLAVKTQSKPLRSALNHMIRALKTGGNLSEIMTQIAEDVAFELSNSMREFSQKLNFFGVIFIFVGIVFPVLVGILAGIKAAPLQTAVLESLPLNGPTVTLFFGVFMPLMLVWLLAYVLITQPKV